MRPSIHLSLLAGVVTAVSGCGVLFPVTDPGETGSSELTRFSSQLELSDYFLDQIRERNGGLMDGGRAAIDLALPDSQPSAGAGDGDAANTSAPQAPVDEDGFSGTTLQEQGVDEADVIKTDGTYFYMLDTRYDGTTVLRIVRAAPLDTLAVMSETVLEGYGQDLYLRGDTVVALTSGGGYFFFGGGGIADDGFAGEPGSVGSGDTPTRIPEGDEATDGALIGPGDPVDYTRPFTAVSIIDVSDRAAPTVTSSTRFDGTPASSRMIDGNLHIVLANYQGYYYDVMPLLGRPELQVADVDVEELLPGYEKTAADGTTVEGDLVTWENLYRPTDPDGFGVVTVVSMDTADPAAPFNSVGIVAEPGLIYSSRVALYLTDTSYDFRGAQRSTTDIYKFNYDGASATPVATGSIPGRILNQYSMGEHDGYLRVATTIDPLFFFDDTGLPEANESVNAIYVLARDGKALTIAGSAEDIAVGDTIQSARFVGDRCFLVTFRQIDPFFTIDLSDPTAPQVVGELEVPGFSTYLTPMDEDHVLAVGQYVPPPGEFGNWGVQLSIFDISDFANPLRSANVVIGGSNGGSYSEALWNPKAFTYYPELGVVALPVSIYGGMFVEDRPGGFGEDVVFDDEVDGIADGGSADVPPPSDPVDEPIAVDVPGAIPDHFEGVVVFSATPEGGLTELGRISTEFGEKGYYYPAYTRGTFIGQLIYAVTNHGLRAAPVSDIADVQGELFYGQEIFFEPPIADQPPDAPGIPEATEPDPGG